MAFKNMDHRLKGYKKIFILSKKKKDKMRVYRQTEYQYKQDMGFLDKRKREISSNSLQSMTKLLSLQSESSYAYKTWI